MSTKTSPTGRKHVNPGDKVRHVSGARGKVLRLDNEPSHVEAFVQWQDRGGLSPAPTPWVALNTLTKDDE